MMKIKIWALEDSKGGRLSGFQQKEPNSRPIISIILIHVSETPNKNQWYRFIDRLRRDIAKERARVRRVARPPPPSDPGHSDIAPVIF